MLDEFAKYKIDDNLLNQFQAVLKTENEAEILTSLNKIVNKFKDNSHKVPDSLDWASSNYYLNAHNSFATSLPNMLGGLDENSDEYKRQGINAYINPSSDILTIAEVSRRNDENFKASVLLMMQPSAKAGNPYSHLKDPENVGKGLDFTASQKRQIIKANMEKNNGKVLSDKSGTVLVKPAKSQKGVTPDPDEWQIDHILSKDKGGTNSFTNAQVLSRKENRLKSNIIESESMVW